MKSSTSAFAIAGFAQVAASGAAATPDKRAVVETYAEIAHSGYEDSLVLARKMRTAVQALITAPSAATMKTARQAWLASRVPYMQTEVYRFGNAVVDDWEGKVDAWPLDEGLIDYVDATSYGAESEQNRFYNANVIASPTLRIGGRTIDASIIDKNLVRSLHEIDEVEANVATGYHAIEFLLWGQDLNGTGPGKGERPWTDFASGDACTGGHCERRRAYLAAANDLLIEDLEEIVASWKAGGEVRKALEDATPEQGLAVILKGM